MSGIFYLSLKQKETKSKCQIFFFPSLYKIKKEMATHSSILAVKILWMEEPGGLQSTGLQRVRHD